MQNSLCTCFTAAGIHSSHVLFSTPSSQKPGSQVLSWLQSRRMLYFRAYSLGVFTSVVHFPCVPKLYRMYHKGTKVVWMSVFLSSLWAICHKAQDMTKLINVWACILSVMDYNRGSFLELGFSTPCVKTCEDCGGKADSWEPQLKIYNSNGIKWDPGICIFTNTAGDA